MFPDYLANYFPGNSFQPFPPGTGKFLPKSSFFIFMLHYTSTGKEETDRPRLGLYFSKEPPSLELKVLGLYSRDINISSGADNYKISKEYQWERDVVLYGIRPHMHLRGVSFKVEMARPDSSKKILLSVPRYDFYLQNIYYFTSPVNIPAGTKIVTHGSYDNSVNNPLNPDPTQWVQWGPSVYDEMFIGFLRYTELD